MPEIKGLFLVVLVFVYPKGAVVRIPWANRTEGDQTRYWPIAAPQGALISGFRVWAAQGRYAGQYWRWAWANRTAGHQTRYWPIAAPQGAPISSTAGG